MSSRPNLSFTVFAACSIDASSLTSICRASMFSDCRDSAAFWPLLWSRLPRRTWYLPVVASCWAA